MSFRRFSYGLVHFYALFHKTKRLAPEWVQGFRYFDENVVFQIAPNCRKSCKKRENRPALIISRRAVFDSTERAASYSAIVCWVSEIAKMVRKSTSKSREFVQTR